jgi:Zn-dependent metalloprotease
MNRIVSFILLLLFLGISQKSLAQSPRVTFWRGEVMMPMTAGSALENDEGRARRFLDNHKELFGVTTTELQATKIVSDNLGMRHVTFQQRYHGIEVYEAKVSVHLRANSVVAVNNDFVEGVDLASVEPQISASQAISMARLALPQGEVLSAPQLVIAENRLAWLVDLKDNASHAIYEIDAQTGFILQEINQVREARERKTYNTYNSTDIPGTLVRTEGSGNNGDKDVDNAHNFAGITYDYYFNTFGRDSMDGTGGTIISTAHYGDFYPNAHYDGTGVAYGDEFAVLDMVAHELTHAVTQHSAGLHYTGEPGALMESFSDIFAAMIDGNWTIGEDLPAWALGGRDALRSLEMPSLYNKPETVNGWVVTCSDDEGVHKNGSIFSKAFYLIATAIGNKKAEQIFYRALTVYLHAQSRFKDARLAA